MSTTRPPGQRSTPRSLTSVARFRSWSASALLIGPEATADAASAARSRGQRDPARVALGLDLEDRRASRPPSTRASTSRVGGPPRRPDGHRLADAHPVTSQAMSPSLEHLGFRTRSGSVRTCLWGSAIHSQTSSGGAAQRRSRRPGASLRPRGRSRERCGTACRAARPLARRADEAAEVVDRGAVRRAGGRDDVLLDHDRAQVVGAEVQRDLADLQALRDPRRLDVVDVVEVDPRDRLRQQVVERWSAFP